MFRPTSSPIVLKETDRLLPSTPSHLETGRAKALDGQSSLMTTRKLVCANVCITAAELVWLMPFAALASTYVEDDRWRLNPLFVIPAYTVALAIASTINEDFFPMMINKSQPCRSFILTCRSFILNSNTNSAMRAFFFGVLDATTRGIITHEYSHILMLELLHGKSGTLIMEPDSTIGLISSGHVTSQSTHLSAIGTILGKDRSNLLIHAAGMVSDFTLGLLMLIIGNLIPDKYKQLRFHLLAVAYISIFMPTQYALGTYIPGLGSSCDENDNYDPCVVEKGGISRLIPLIAPLAIAFLVQISFILAKKYRNQGVGMEAAKGCTLFGTKRVVEVIDDPAELSLKNQVESVDKADETQAPTPRFKFTG